MNKLVQCVPNFSEGRDLAIIEKIVEPLKNQEGFKLVSYENDGDYNRTVVTLLGDPEKMIEPLLNFTEQVLLNVDMNFQSGEHARMGAIDVLPFIPINNITMDECVEYANIIAKKINNKFDIPIFMYAEAANKKDRKRLPNIRKGEFEGMKEKIKEDNWIPDYGKREIHPTFGVIGIGARVPLIAYNIDLDTEDITIPKKIAQAIRNSSGGFTFVQAGPVYLNERGHVQVTMNILNYKKNPVYRIFETVKMEALRYNVDVTNSELVGLIPKDAVVRSLKYYFSVNNIEYNNDFTLEEITMYAIKYLKFRDFNKEKIIEANI